MIGREKSTQLILLINPAYPNVFVNKLLTEHFFILKIFYFITFSKYMYVQLKLNQLNRDNCPIRLGEFSAKKQKNGRREVLSWICNIHTILENIGDRAEYSQGKISTAALSPIISEGSTLQRESVRGVTSITPLG